MDQHFSSDVNAGWGIFFFAAPPTRSKAGGTSIGCQQISAKIPMVVAFYLFAFPPARSKAVNFMLPILRGGADVPGLFFFIKKFDFINPITHC